MSSLMSQLAAESAEPTRHMAWPVWGYALVSMLFFLGCLGLLWSFRNTAAKAGEQEMAHGHGAPGGAGGSVPSGTTH